MTVPKHLAIHRHVANLIGIGKSTAHDANDGDDDDWQRFSKGVCPSLLRLETMRGAGSKVSATATKPVAATVTLGLYEPALLGIPILTLFSQRLLVASDGLHVLLGRA